MTGEAADAVAKRWRILVVDDEPSVARAISRLLTSMGHEVQVELEPQAAVHRLRADPLAFDLLITDQTMPGMTGDLVARAVREIRADLPVVVCTGYSEHYHVDDAARDGVRAFLSKPFDREALRALLAALE
jgi:CheY-like chemotaxis protein